MFVSELRYIIISFNYFLYYSINFWLSNQKGKGYPGLKIWQRIFLLLIYLQLFSEILQLSLLGATIRTENIQSSQNSPHLSTMFSFKVVASKSTCFDVKFLISSLEQVISQVGVESILSIFVWTSCCPHWRGLCLGDSSNFSRVRGFCCF